MLFTLFTRLAVDLTVQLISKLHLFKYFTYKSELMLLSICCFPFASYPEQKERNIKH